MKNIITPQNATMVCFDEYIIKASDCGLMPGEWPETIDTTIGNTLPFVRLRTETSDGKVMAVFYKQDSGKAELTILNS
jgi:hypothetical protein